MGLCYGSVLVHCQRGISRSATCVLFYLMRKAGMTLEEALKVCQRRRPQICPNPAFMEQLSRYETQCRQLGVLSCKDIGQRGETSARKGNAGRTLGPTRPTSGKRGPVRGPMVGPMVGPSIIKNPLRSEGQDYIGPKSGCVGPIVGPSAAAENTISVGASDTSHIIDCIGPSLQTHTKKGSVCGPMIFSNVVKDSLTSKCSDKGPKVEHVSAHNFVKDSLRSKGYDDIGPNVEYALKDKDGLMTGPGAVEKSENIVASEIGPVVNTLVINNGKESCASESKSIQDSSQNTTPTSKKYFPANNMKDALAEKSLEEEILCPMVDSTVETSSPQMWEDRKRKDFVHDENSRSISEDGNGSSEVKRQKNED
mmetsp:Transcript_24338/g.28021  ORF Transcript_24338/g.28021 Transcript_24338/m.28021 type:complete len:367 (-) Transcript_24338:254-1354(-)